MSLDRVMVPGPHPMLVNYSWGVPLGSLIGYTDPFCDHRCVQRCHRTRGKCGFLRCSRDRSEEHTSELQSRFDLVCRLLLDNRKRYLCLMVVLYCFCCTLINTFISPFSLLDALPI